MHAHSRWQVAAARHPAQSEGWADMTTRTHPDEETGSVTGTADKDYNLIWFIESCLSNALRLQQYIADAERHGDNELADLFRRAQKEEP